MGKAGGGGWGNKAECGWSGSRGCGAVLLPGGWHFRIETGQNAEKPGGMLPSSKPLLSGNWLRGGVETGPQYQLIYCRHTQAYRLASRAQGFP